MIPKPIESITKEDVESLLCNKVAEGRTLDYKLTLPGGKDDDKKEFLADVSSFTNAAGGDLIFGISEVAGVPDALPGLAGIDVDAETLRLENVIRDGVEPRIPGVQIRAVDGFPSGPVLIIRLPRSWASPHMVTFKGTSRFFTRNSAGKYQMDVGELRSAFAASESLGERLQRFRTDRLSKIISGETPVPLPPTPKMVLHILPFSSFSVGSYIDERLKFVLRTQMPPLGSGGFSSRYNLEGLVSFSSSSRRPDPAESYCQFFRTGAVESVWADLVADVGGRPMIPSVLYEQYLIQGVEMYLKGLAEVQAPLPLLISLSMVGVRGVEMATDGKFFRSQSTPIDRDVLLLPDVVVEQYDVDVPRMLRPIFDAAWNAAGYERSFNYDNDGIWKPG